MCYHRGIGLIILGFVALATLIASWIAAALTKLTILWPFGILGILERWKGLVSECLVSWSKPKVKKKNIFQYCLLLFYAKTLNHFSNALWCVMKSGFSMTTGDAWLSGWTKKKLQSTSQSQTYAKNWSWSLFGGVLPVWSTIAFWILAKPLHLRRTK